MYIPWRTLAVWAFLWRNFFSEQRTRRPERHRHGGSILIAAFVFQPIANGFRNSSTATTFIRTATITGATLIEFARELAHRRICAKCSKGGGPPDPDAGYSTRAFFRSGTKPKKPSTWELASNREGRKTQSAPYGLDLSFFDCQPGETVFVFRAHSHMLDVVSA